MLDIDFSSAVKLLYYSRILNLSFFKENGKFILVHFTNSNLKLPKNKIAIKTFWDVFVFKYHIPYGSSRNPKLILDFG